MEEKTEVEQKISEKETFYGTWEDFEKATGMSKSQYFEREKDSLEELATQEVECCIYRS